MRLLARPCKAKGSRKLAGLSLRRAVMFLQHSYYRHGIKNVRKISIYAQLIKQLFIIPVLI